MVEVTKIQYTKVISEDASLNVYNSSIRSVIMTSSPGNIRAIDVTELSDDRKQEISELYEEYTVYFNNHMKSAFSFENWLSHSKGIDFTPKWRTFKPDQTKIIT